MATEEQSLDQVLVTDREAPSRTDILATAQRLGVNEIMVPRDILVVPAIPLLGTGKIDYPALQRMVEERPPSR